MKIRRMRPEDGWHAQGWVHWCPGCENIHGFAVERPFHNGAKWTFDGNEQRPTFAPSMNIGPGYCHYFLKEGRLQFLSDCSHAFAGKTVDLPDLPEEDR